MANPYIFWVVYLLIPTSNHNKGSINLVGATLYIFWFLHQTTTASVVRDDGGTLYIFWFLHQTTTEALPYISPVSCISFDSYIKPQRKVQRVPITEVVYLLIPTSNHNSIWGNTKNTHVVYLLIPTSNHNHIGIKAIRPMVVYLLIPTSNHNQANDDLYVKQVVYLLIPTSNHNLWVCLVLCTLVVYLLIPTSNHNSVINNDRGKRLYIFWFLHQTTTLRVQRYGIPALYIFWFLHQTTTGGSIVTEGDRLYIFWFLHQTTTILIILQQ